MQVVSHCQKLKNCHSWMENCLWTVAKNIVWSCLARQGINTELSHGKGEEEDGVSTVLHWPQPPLPESPCSLAPSLQLVIQLA